MADLALFESVMGSELDTVGCVDVGEVVAVGVLVLLSDSVRESVVHEHAEKYPLARQ